MHATVCLPEELLVGLASFVVRHIITGTVLIVGVTLRAVDRRERIARQQVIVCRKYLQLVQIAKLWRDHGASELVAVQRKHLQFLQMAEKRRHGLCKRIEMQQQDFQGRAVSN